MNYIKHLTGFFIQIAHEATLNPTHISLYLALFQRWNMNRFKNPITISRDEMMKASKIASKATYHKCIKELQRLRFIDYIPSYNPYAGTTVVIHDLSNGTSTKNRQPNSQVAEQVAEPSIYSKPILKTKRKQYKETTPEKIEIKKEENSIPVAKESIQKTHPALEIVKEYFSTQQASEFEAERFFNYYTSNGWLIGGKTKMKDWQAAARNWILNTAKFSSNLPPKTTGSNKPQAQNLHTSLDKDYDEPL
jgi:hypothetical protein